MPLPLCLWFDGQASDAAKFYVEVFRACGRPASGAGEVTNGDAGPGPADAPMTVEFTLDGQPFLGLNGGPHYKFSPAVSLMVMCDDQAEVDLFWARLTDGGAASRCGWLTDRFGLSWQVVPKALGAMMRDPDPARRDRVMRAFMPMTKLELAPLQRAYAAD